MNFPKYKKIKYLVLLYLMHLRLYSPIIWKKPTSSFEMMSILKVLANLTYPNFRLFLIGSRIGVNKPKSDIDIYLCPNHNKLIKNIEVQKMLISLKSYARSKKVIVDIIYKSKAPNISREILTENTELHFIKILSPNIKKKISEKSITKYKLIEDYLVEFKLKAKNTNFFAKLPELEFNGKKERYLRVAKEIKAST